ncbi:hypothetical protein HGRIS_001827 [Hohenbuehelia grisea]|uniref:Ricin B lectin domain-containing protein n=1 Tax=Hohenbuehelia grisea TaxID=104357 RepID=A0ABR3JIP4_9AGAR
MMYAQTLLIVAAVSVAAASDPFAKRQLGGVNASDTVFVTPTSFVNSTFFPSPTVVANASDTVFIPPTSFVNSTFIPTATANATTVTSIIGSPTGLPVVRLHPNNQTNKCLDVARNEHANGVSVQIYVFDCNGTGAQNWVLGFGSTKVQLNGTNLCLDAGSNPGSGTLMKIWQCFDNLPAQQWFHTGDNRIALENKGQCLDLPSGNSTNNNRVQIWQCADFNTNQIWTSN